MPDDSLRRGAAIFAQAPVGLAGLDAAGELRQVNARFARLLGWGIDQLEAVRLHDLIVDPYGVAFTACLADIVRGTQDKSRLELPLRRGDHGMIWIDMTLGRMTEPAGEAGPPLAMIVEIRERDGRPSQTLVDRLMQVSPAVVYTMRADDLTTMTFVSQNVATVTGWSPQSLMDAPDWLETHVHPDDFQRVLGQLTRWLSNGAPGYARLHYRQRTPEGRWQWLDDQMTTVRDAEGRIVELVGAFRDVSDRVEITQRLEKLARHVPGVLFQYRRTADGQPYFTYASGGALDILGLSQEQLEGDASRAFDRCHPDDLPALLVSMERSFHQLTPWELRLRVLHPQRGEIWLEGRASPEREEDGGVLGHGVFLDISRQKELESRLAHQALHDPLTATANRRHFEPLMKHEARRVIRYGTPCSLVMLDLDHFKAVNDTFGHELGDEILCRVVATLKERLRETDVLGRWGGEEFIVLLPNTSDEYARQVAEQLRLHVERMEVPEAGHVTISLGVSEYRPAEDTKVWIKRADDAMYAAKRAGRNRVG